MFKNINVDTGVHRRFNVRHRKLVAVSNGMKIIPELLDKLSESTSKPRRIEGDRRFFSVVGKGWVIASRPYTKKIDHRLVLKPNHRWVIVNHLKTGDNGKVESLKEIPLREAVRFIHDSDPDVFEVDQWKTKFYNAVGISE